MSQFSYQTKARPPYSCKGDFKDDLWIVIEVRKKKQNYKEDVYKAAGSGYSCNSCRLKASDHPGAGFCRLGGFEVGWRSGCIEHVKRT